MTDADMIEAMARAIGPSFIGNRMPDMSGDPLRKATPYERRRIDEAVVAALAVVRPEIDRLRAERDKAREYGAQARIRENEERAKFEEMRGRAEAAETHSAALARALEEAKGVWKPISALWSKPAECGKGCPPRQVCDFCQRELFLGWNGDYVELWNTTNYYLCRERSEPHWKHMAEEAARLTHFMAFDMPDRASSLLAPKEDTDA